MVYRELKRAGCAKGRWGCYDAEAAQQDAEERSLRPKRAKLAALPELAGEVRELPGDEMVAACRSSRTAAQRHYRWPVGVR